AAAAGHAAARPPAGRRRGHRGRRGGPGPAARPGFEGAGPMSTPTGSHLIKLAKRIAGRGIAAPPLADLPGLLGVEEESLAVDLAALIGAGHAVVWEECESGPSLILSSLAVEDPSADPNALELARLVRQQRRDRLGVQRHSSKKEVLAADLGDKGEG